MRRQPRPRTYRNRPPAGSHRNTYVYDSVSGAWIHVRKAVRDGKGGWVDRRNKDTEIG